jgi:hypothetical protein
MVTLTNMETVIALDALGKLSQLRIPVMPKNGYGICFQVSRLTTDRAFTPETPN